MRYFLQVVRKYEGTRPVFHETGDLANYELDPDRDILSRSRSVKFRTTVYQGRSDFFRVGKMSIELNAAQLRWIPRAGWLQFDRDHLLTVTTDAGIPVWRGYATGVKWTANQTAAWDFSSQYDRLDDVNVAGDPDENRIALPAQEIVDEIAALLPDVWPAGVDASAWANVFRPARDVSARDFIARVLTAEGQILLPDGTGALEVRAIAPRQDSFDPATGLTIGNGEVTGLTLLDDKLYMYNTITYTPHGGERTTYQGDLTAHRAPGNFFHRYGRRELQMDFDHLNAGNAERAAIQWQGRLITPKRRVRITLPNPEDRVLLLDRVKLELDDVADTRLPLWGEFAVTALSVDLDRDAVELELEDTNRFEFTVPDPSLRAPVANAGADQVVDAGVEVTLDGSASSDPDGAIVAYAWRQVSGVTVALSDASAAQASFEAPAEVVNSNEILTFELEVTDSDGLVATDTVIVTVNRNLLEQEFMLPAAWWGGSEGLRHWTAPANQQPKFANAFEPPTVDRYLASILFTGAATVLAIRPNLGPSTSQPGHDLNEGWENGGSLRLEKGGVTDTIDVAAEADKSDPYSFRAVSAGLRAAVETAGTLTATFRMPAP